MTSKKSKCNGKSNNNGKDNRNYKCRDPSPFDYAQAQDDDEKQTTAKANATATATANTGILRFAQNDDLDAVPSIEVGVEEVFVVAFHALDGRVDYFDVGA